MNNSYNGFANYQTWNVALWISNDEWLYSIARRFSIQGYAKFAAELRAFSIVETLDGVAYNDSGLDIPALDEALLEIYA